LITHTSLGLVMGRLDCMWDEQDGVRGIRFNGQGHHDRHLAGSTIKLALVAVPRIERGTRGL